MSLDTLTQTIHTRLTQLGVTGVARSFGGEHIARNAAPPRVVWVPQSGVGGPARNLAGSRLDRSIRTRQVTMDAHIWGSTSDATEALLTALICAVHDVCSAGSYTFNGEQWAEGNASDTAHGRVVVASFTFGVPVTYPTGTTASVVIASETHDVALSAE